MSHFLFTVTSENCVLVFVTWTISCAIICTTRVRALTYSCIRIPLSIGIRFHIWRWLCAALHILLWLAAKRFVAAAKSSLIWDMACDEIIITSLNATRCIRLYFRCSLVTKNRFLFMRSDPLWHPNVLWARKFWSCLDTKSNTKQIDRSAHFDKKQKWSKQRLLFTWNTNRQETKQSAHETDEEKRKWETHRARSVVRCLMKKMKYIYVEMNEYRVQVHAASAWSVLSCAFHAELVHSRKHVEPCERKSHKTSCFLRFLHSTWRRIPYAKRGAATAIANTGFTSVQFFSWAHILAAWVSRTLLFDGKFPLTTALATFELECWRIN